MRYDFFSQFYDAVLEYHYRPFRAAAVTALRLPVGSLAAFDQALKTLGKKIPFSMRSFRSAKEEEARRERKAFYLAG